jgi:tRNA nucleotidyltransferase (CCA-adding enzyme)|tara:strand:+ start:1459 stop:2709 length:1251 start_codon:yes stop_codon:yes gene_type:complete
MKTYLVGGAVRDQLLKLPVKDKDWVVVGASPNELIEKGYSQVGSDFPVFLHPQSKEEYALARTERKSAAGHKGFEVHYAKEVTLEEDLMRRDLTINAIAQAPSGDLIDPYNGLADIKNKVLRHVSNAFIEDPLRVLRVARFAARFAHLGFAVAPETLALMEQISNSGELRLLSSERVWREVSLALKADTPAEFIKTLRDCGALKIILPEVDALFGVPQPVKYHPEIDTGLHILLSLEQAALLTPDPTVRYAVLVHDVGKGITDPEKWPSHSGHEKMGVDLLKTINTRLKVPNEYAQLAAVVCEYHTLLHRVTELSPATLLLLLESADAIRRPERFEKFILACEADARGRTGLEKRDYPQHRYLSLAKDAVAKVDSRTALDANPDLPPKEAIGLARLGAISTYVVSWAQTHLSDTEN